jgi:hypothetical protein
MLSIEKYTFMIFYHNSIKGVCLAFVFCAILATPIFSQTLDLRLAYHRHFGVNFGTIATSGEPNVVSHPFTNNEFEISYIHKERLSLAIGFYYKDHEVLLGKTALLPNFAVAQCKVVPILLSYRYTHPKYKNMCFVAGGGFNINKFSPHVYIGDSILLSQPGTEPALTFWFTKTPNEINYRVVPQVRLGFEYGLNSWLYFHCKWALNHGIISMAKGRWEMKDTTQNLFETGRMQTRGSYHFLQLGVQFRFP